MLLVVGESALVGYLPQALIAERAGVEGPTSHFNELVAENLPLLLNCTSTACKMETAAVSLAATDGLSRPYGRVSVHCSRKQAVFLMRSYATGSLHVWRSSVAAN